VRFGRHSLIWGSRCQAQIFPHTRFSLSSILHLSQFIQPRRAVNESPEDRAEGTSGLTAQTRAELLLSHCFAPGTSGTLTRYEAEPAWSGQVIVATSLYSAGISTVDSPTMMQIYASAARLRSSGAHSCIRHESHWLWRANRYLGSLLGKTVQRRTKTDDIPCTIDVPLLSG
jgi:hypothetical protein